MKQYNSFYKNARIVSNPWREAIEGNAVFPVVYAASRVSNPWREAIEGEQTC